MLAALKAAGRRVAILSNGSPAMLEAAGGLGRDRGVGRRGPVGRGGGRVQARCAGLRPSWGGISAWRRDEVLFVSSNGWDAAGAAHYGFRTVWVNRAGEPVDRLPARPGTCDGGPDRDTGAGGGSLMRFTAADGVSLHFTDEGPRDGKVGALSGRSDTQ